MADAVIIPDDDNLTPAMKQFKEFKGKYPDCIIFFRMGDFYELFYNDAVIASKELEITLTKRGSKARIPLAGIPYHAIDIYLPRLVKKGYKVAICEQVEDPKKAKGIVKRDVIRIISPGTLMTDTQLMEKSNNFLMSISNEGDKFGISICDLSTGELKTTISDYDNLISEISKFNPSEIIISNSFNKKLPTEIFTQRLSDNYFSYKYGYETLISHFDTITLEGFGIEDCDLCVSSCGAIINYLQKTQMTNLSHISTIHYYSTNSFMLLDKATIRNLELTNNIIDNTKRNTLLEIIDKTNTPMGARLIRDWIVRPLIDINKINERLDSVEIIINTPFLKEEINDLLKNINDIERLISKINYKSANARDLISLNNSLKTVPFIKELISRSALNIFKDRFNIDNLNEIIQLIEPAIISEPPLTVREGGMIKRDYNPELDKLHDICINGKKYISDLEEKERKKTKISSLKVGFNKVFGYFIEITNKYKDQVPDDYIRKQTRVNSERYITQELKELESDILTAEEKIHNLEYEIFSQILDKIANKTKEIQQIAKDIAILDCITSFAKVSVDNDYVKPEINEKFDINIIDGRHPVIEKHTRFIPNDCNFSNETMMKIITGPNMGGKSTYQRQNALIILLGQIGCFVPAKNASNGIVDRIFTRVGAHDDLASGQSTFMVEMSETANILNNATCRSFIILDEIGRGTSTFDGVSIAWSIAEYIYKTIRAKTLFATHYHVLTKLANNPGIKNYSVLVKERNDEIIFLRKIVANATNKSFGIQVAKLSGLPKQVIVRAKEIMADLEAQDNMKKNVKDKTDDNEIQMNLVDL